MVVVVNINISVDDLGIGKLKSGMPEECMQGAQIIELNDQKKNSHDVSLWNVESGKMQQSWMKMVYS